MSREAFREAYPDRMVLAADDDLDGETRKYAESDVAGESKTRQADLDASDINKIVKRFERDGIVPLSNREGLYLDVSEVPDYREAIEQVRRADEYFMSLPASSRAMFNNDPAEFLDKVNDPTQLDLLVEAGVIPKDEVKPVVPAAGDAGAAKEPPSSP